MKWPFVPMLLSQHQWGEVLKVDIKYKNYTGTQTFYVVAAQGPSLLGR